MKKTLKILAASAGFVFALLATAVLALKIFFPADKLKALAEAEGERRLGRKVEIGSVGLGLFSGLRVEKVRVSERPDFSAGEFLKAEALVLRPELSALLHRRLVVRELACEGLEARVTLEKDGRYNFQDLLGPAAAPAGGKPAAPAALPLALLVDSVRLSGALTYTDRVQKARTRVEGLKVRASGIRLAGDFPLSAAARLAYEAAGQTYEAAVSASGRVDLAGLDMSALGGVFDAVRLDYKGVAVTGEVSFKGALKTKLEGKVHVPALGAADLRRLSGSAAVPEALALPASELSFSMTYAQPALRASSLDFEMKGFSAKGSASVPDVFAKTPGFSANFSLTGAGGLKAELAARAAGDAEVVFNGGLDLLDAGPLSALLPPPAAAAKPAAAPAPAAPPAAYKGPALKTRGRFTIAKITHPNFQAQALELSWDLDGITPGLDKLDGKAAFRLGPGGAKDLLALAEQRPGMKAMVLPLKALDRARSLPIPGLKIPPLNDLAFTKVQGDYAFKKGVMSMQPFLLDGPVLYAESRGEVNLPAQTLDLKMNVKAEGASVNLFAKGPMADPKITPDLGKVEKQLENEVKKQLEKKGKELLKGLFR